MNSLVLFVNWLLLFLTTTTTTTKRFKSVLPVDNKIQFSRVCTCRMCLTNLQIEGIVAMEH